MDELFASLRNGARFDRKRFTSDIDAFRTDKPTTDEDGAAARKADRSIVDFFGDSTPAPVAEASSSAKKKNNKRASEGADNSAGAEKKRQRGASKSAKKKNKKGQAAVEEEEEEVEEEVTGLQQEEVGHLRRQLRISCAGTDVPAPCARFDDMPLGPKQRKWLLRNIEETGWTEPTPIQMQASPCLLAGRDLIACAPTGSGKTAAFVIPILALLKAPEKSHCRAIILAPTRELAKQTFQQCNLLGNHRKFKIKLLTKATAAATADQQSSCDLLITTPLRLVGAINGKEMDLSKVSILVVDEADRLFEEGFVEQIDEIFAACTAPQLQRALFSATLPPVVEELALTVLRDPVRVTIGGRNGATETVKQKLLFVGNEEGKLLAMRQLVQAGLTPPVLVFVQSKDRAKELFRELIYDGINVDIIHSDRTQAQRDAVVTNFRTGKVWVLICTELMGRGMDFKGVRLVINYDFPQSVFSYIHRIGRTGRAGKTGEAVTYFTRDDAPLLRSIANVMRQSGCEVPEWMLKLKKISTRDRRNLNKHAPERHAISTVPAFDRNRLHNKKDAIRNTKAAKSQAAN